MRDRHQRSDDTAELDDEIFTNKSNFVLFTSKGLCGFSVEICSFGMVVQTLTKKIMFHFHLIYPRFLLINKLSSLLNRIKVPSDQQSNVLEAFICKKEQINQQIMK